MIITELILVSFGKFINKKLKLKEGINIVYGDNEAGKTTIHKFIEGMFYGFFKPYTKRKVYTDDYDRHFPWYNNDYRGILKYKCDEKIYRIERNFLKGSEEIKVIDDKTGEDLTHFYEYDKVKRLYEPASLHLGLNNVVYNNTISVKQLGNKTEKDLAKEVKDSLINLGGTMDEDISVKRVIENLTKEINEIGTKNRVKTSPYGKIIDDIQNLEKERKNALKILNEVKEYQEKLNSIYDEINRLNNKKELVQNNKILLEAYKAKDKYTRALELMGEVKKIEKEIDRLKKYKDVNPEEYTEAVSLENSVKASMESYNNFLEKLDKLRHQKENNVNSLSPYSGFDSVKDLTEIDEIISDFLIMENKEKELLSITKKMEDTQKRIDGAKSLSVIDLNDDYYKYEEMEGEMNRLLYNKDFNNLLFLKSRYEEKEKGLKRFKVYKILCSLGALALIPLGIKIDSLFFLTLSIPVGLLVYLIFAAKEMKKYLGKLKNQIDDIENNEKKAKERINILENQMKAILNKYNCSDKTEFRKTVNEYSKEASLLKENQILLNQLDTEKKSIEREIEKYKGIIKKYFSLAGIDGPISFENVRIVKERYNKYLELKKQNLIIEREIKELTQEVDEIKTKIDKYEKQTKDIYLKNNVKDIKEYKKAVGMKKQYDEFINAYTNKSNLLNSILGENNLEYLKKIATKFSEEDLKKVKGLDADSLKKELEEISVNLVDKSKEATRIEEKIRNLSSITRTLVDIEEDIIRKNKIKEKYERKLAALEMAISTIEKISKNIQRDFAPRLNKKVGDIISNITDRKYTEVKITENIDIKVVEPETHRLISIEELSGGTIDQMYFATRFGIIDIIKGDKNVPIILDDCFIQYDNTRLGNIMEFLAQEGVKRQIILFTCHTREKKIFDRLNVKYNYVEL
jgi:DNA repair exonuclease SbcCD ATPase subunit